MGNGKWKIENKKSDAYLRISIFHFRISEFHFPSDVARAAQESSREQDQRAEEFKGALHGNPNDSKGKQQKPDERVEHQGEQGKRPTENQENAPEQELDHGRSPSNWKAAGGY